MKIRTRNAPARIPSGISNHHEIVRLRYIRYQSSAYGTSVLINCQTARGVEGSWYLDTICFQAATSAWRFPSLGLSSFITNKPLFTLAPILRFGKERFVALEGRCKNNSAR